MEIQCNARRRQSVTCSCMRGQSWASAWNEHETKWAEIDIITGALFKDISDRARD